MGMELSHRLSPKDSPLGSALTGNIPRGVGGGGRGGGGRELLADHSHSLQRGNGRRKSFSPSPAFSGLAVLGARDGAAPLATRDDVI